MTRLSDDFALKLINEICPVIKNFSSIFVLFVFLSFITETMLLKVVKDSVTFETKKSFNAQTYYVYDDLFLFYIH